ncbi:diguanylate cyclase, partial [Verrucomicrobiota bacterium]
GEEFVIICEGNEFTSKVSALEELLKSIRGHKFAMRSKSRPRRKPKYPWLVKSSSKPKTITVTVSIGVAKNNRRYSSPQEVLEAADKALYKAKNAGRNRLQAAR